MPWLSVSKAYFGCPPGNVTQIKIQMRTTASPGGLISQIQALLVESRSGRQIVGLQADNTSPVLTVSSDMLILGNSGKGTLVIQNANRGGKMLEGTIETTGLIVAEPAGSFRSNHLIVAIKSTFRGWLRGGDAGQVVIKSNGGNETIPVRHPSREDV